MQHYRDDPVFAAAGASNADLQDYYDHGIPPPHRLSGIEDPYAGNSLLRNTETPVTDRSSYQPIMPAQNQGYTNVDAPYGNKDYSSSQWLEQQQSGNRKAKWIVVGSLIGLAILVAVGVTVGVVVSKNNSKNNASGASSSSSGSSTGAVKQSNPNDPSTFEKDPNLKHSFYGLAYTPEGSQYPACGNSLDAVIEDIQLISQLTSRIRLYGADCNQSALVLEAIQRTKVDLGVYLGNYNIPTDDAPYIRQRDAIIDALKTYGADHVLGVTVGNEYMLNYLNANGAQDPNSAIGNAGAQLLIPNITDTRNAIAELNLGKTIPVGTADAGSYFNNEVLAAVDYGMSNVHPWFANVSIDQAADWTAQFFQETNVAVAQTLSNKPQMFIAETGWPSQSSDAGNESNGPSTASEENLQKFLDTFVCQANQNNTGYFYFEYFDEEWKDKQFGGVEGWWGLFHRNKTLKAITIPDCHID